MANGSLSYYSKKFLVNSKRNLIQFLNISSLAVVQWDNGQVYLTFEMKQAINFSQVSEMQWLNKEISDFTQIPCNENFVH